MTSCFYPRNPSQSAEPGRWRRNSWTAGISPVSSTSNVSEAATLTHSSTSPSTSTDSESPSSRRHVQGRTISPPMSVSAQWNDRMDRYLDTFLMDNDVDPAGGGKHNGMRRHDDDDDEHRRRPHEYAQHVYFHKPTEGITAWTSMVAFERDTVAAAAAATTTTSTRTRRRPTTPPRKHIMTTATAAAYHHHPGDRCDNIDPLDRPPTRRLIDPQGLPLKFLGRFEH